MPLSSSRRAEKRKRFLAGTAALAVIVIVGLGVFAENR